LQNRAVRIITQSGYENRSAEIMENLDWKTLEHRWDINIELLMFKVVNNAVPVYLVSQFSKRDEVHDTMSVVVNLI
jgi:hypothetical protein